MPVQVVENRAGKKVLLSPPQGIERKPETETKQPQTPPPDSEQPQDNAGQDGGSLEQPAPGTAT